MPSGSRVTVTGMGVVTSIGHDIPTFTTALRDGVSGIGFLSRIPTDQIQIKIGAEVRGHSWQDHIGRFAPGEKEFFARARKVLNRAPDSTRLSACATLEALVQSRLLSSGVARDRIGLIIAGNNIHQRYIHENGAKFQSEPQYINPTYALSFFDTSQVGSLSEICGIHGMGYTVGGASASGNVALYHAWQWLRHGVVDACVVTGAAADFSAIELQALCTLGAACMAAEPAKACRPFDRQRSGFVFGEGSGSVILERAERAEARGAKRLGELKGASLVLDGNSLANPSQDGAVRAMRLAVEESGLAAREIGCVNAHATASVLGDETECEAIATFFQDHARIVPVNSTKSLTGHCMYAAGVVEFIATLIQLNEGFLHPNLNLDEPLTDRLNFADSRARALDAKYALTNAFGFGGFNSSVVAGKA